MVVPRISYLISRPRLGQEDHWEGSRRAELTRGKGTDSFYIRLSEATEKQLYKIPKLIVLLFHKAIYNCDFFPLLVCLCDFVYLEVNI